MFKLGVSFRVNLTRIIKRGSVKLDLLLFCILSFCFSEIRFFRCFLHFLHSLARSVSFLLNKIMIFTLHYLNCGEKKKKKNVLCCLYVGQLAMQQCCKSFIALDKMLFSIQKN